MVKKISKILNRVFLLFYRHLFGLIAYARRTGVKVGSNCRIYTTNFGSEPFLITIGNHVTITAGVTFITHDGSGWLFRDEKGRRYFYAPIEIGNNVFIGVNSIILPGVKIESNVIVAAGSVVTKSVPSNSIVAGVPAKIIGRTDTFKDKVLNEWVSDINFDRTGNYKSKIDQLLSKQFKNFLQ